MEKIKMTQAGYDKKLAEFDRIKQLLKETSKNKIQSAYDGSGDTWHDNFTYEQLDLQEEGLISRLERMQEELNNVIIVEKEKLDSSFVNIGDKILIEITYFDGEKDELAIILDDSFHEDNSVSLNSPLGKVLYKAKIGETYEYDVGGNINKVVIKKKLLDGGIKMNFIIRNCELEDCLAVEQVKTLGWQQTYRGIVNDEFLHNLSENEQERTEKFIESFEKKEDSVFVLEIDKKIVGFVKCGKSRYDEYSGDGQIIALYIINGYKGYGFGKMLFLKAMNELVKLGFNNVIIGCLEGNPSNEFYKHMGGKKIGVHKMTIAEQTLDENIYYFENVINFNS